MQVFLASALCFGGKVVSERVDLSGKKIGCICDAAQEWGGKDAWWNRIDREWLEEQGAVLVDVSLVGQDAGAWAAVLAGGVVRGLSRMLMLLSFSYILVAYTISIKRVSLLFAVLLGWWFFGESQVRQKLVACLIMLSGVLLIVFGG